jgi:hypothetical protein
MKSLTVLLFLQKQRRTKTMKAGETIIFSYSVSSFIPLSFLRDILAQKETNLIFFIIWLHFLYIKLKCLKFIVRSQQSVMATFNRKSLQSVLDFPNKIFLTIKFSRCRIFLSVFIIVYVYEAEFEQKVKKSLAAGTCRQ